MKMIRTLFILTISLTLHFTSTAQEAIDVYLKEAQGYVAQKNYAQAQLSLQDAMNAINTLIGKQIAESLPDDINGLKAEGVESNAAAMGMLGGGLTVNKMYRHPAKESNEASVSILANSPMLSMMNMYLTNPSLMGSEYKSIRVGTRRAILKTEMQDYYDDNASKSIQIRSTEIQIPLSQTLITINAKGFATEADELAFANKIDLEKLKASLGEP